MARTRVRRWLMAVAAAGVGLVVTALLPTLPAFPDPAAQAPAAQARTVRAPGIQAPVRIMTLGDSITGSPGCWRAMLWNRLQGNGFTDIDFVGTLPPQGCGVAHDGDNEGHGGFLATNIANQNLLPGWLSATTPDIVVMHLGTNDVWNNLSPSTVLGAFSTLVGQLRASNPGMKVLVARIIPMNPPNCAACGQRVVALNDAMPAWAAGITTAQSPVTLVDQWTGFSTAADTYDGVHPNDAGNRRIADRWYPALSALLTPGPGPTTTTTPPPGRGCTATYRLVGQWQGEFQGEVTIRNTGTSTTTAWTARLTFTAGQQLRHSWGGIPTRTPPTVTVTNEPWNGTLTPDATATFGFIATWTTTNPPPTVACDP